MIYARSLARVGVGVVELGEAPRSYKPRRFITEDMLPTTSFGIGIFRSANAGSNSSRARCAAAAFPRSPNSNVLVLPGYQ